MSLVLRRISLSEGHRFALDWVFDPQSSEVSEQPLGQRGKKLLAAFKMKFINFGGDYMTGLLR